MFITICNCKAPGWSASEDHDQPSPLQPIWLYQNSAPFRSVLPGALNTFISAINRRMKSLCFDTIFVGEDKLCVLCNLKVSEDRDHLCWSCPFSRSCCHTLEFSLVLTLTLMRFLLAPTTASASLFSKKRLFPQPGRFEIPKYDYFFRVTPSLVSWMMLFRRDLYLSHLDLIFFYCQGLPTVFSVKKNLQWFYSPRPKLSDEILHVSRRLLCTDKSIFGQIWVT